jgi:hypothetical protein
MDSHGTVDSVRGALVVGGVALGVMFVCATIVFWQNRQSRNIALAGGALVAASVLIVTQLLYELQAPWGPQRELVDVEYTIDLLAAGIRSWSYSSRLITRNPATVLRMGNEIAASGILKNLDPAAFGRDGTRLSEDFAWFSVVSFIATTQSDWQLMVRHHTGPVTGHVFSGEPRSLPNERTSLEREALHGMFVGSGNISAVAPIGTGEIWLPPQTSVALTATALTLANPFCQLVVTIEPSSAVRFTVPSDNGGLNQRVMPSGEPQDQTRALKVVLTTTYFKLRAQSPEMVKYRARAENFATDLHDWFRYEERK